MKVAMMQCNTVVGDIEGNVGKLLSGYEHAASNGADICVTPELAVVGYPPRDLLLYPSFLKKAEEALGTLTQATAGKRTALVVGTIGPNTSGQGMPLHNEAVFLEAGTVVVRYAKRLLPTYDVFDEARYFEPGGGPCVVQFQGRRLALTVCEDIWHDGAYKTSVPNYTVDPLREHPPFDTLVNLSASPFCVRKQEERRRLLGAIAASRGIRVCYVNAVGGNDELIFDGRSLHVLPNGAVGTEGQAFAEDMLIVDVDAMGRGAPPLLAPPEEAWRALTLGLQDYCHKTGQKSVVVGLSGGVDSSLTAALAVNALGSENVTGLLLPSQYSSGHSLVDAHALAKTFNLQTAVLHIESVMLAYDRILAELFMGRPPDVTEENLQARIRGTLLMACANKFGRLLLTTGNKSEISVGYCTIYGDMCGALAVIGDLYKTEVYSICHWINSRHPSCIPEHVLFKAPSAELRPGQTDQDNLPPYPELDAMLRGILEERLGEEELVAKGHNRETVRKVAKLVAMAEFKRRQAAPVLKITRNAFGMGWRMPIACRQAYEPAPPKQQQG
ncbi:MAG: NAD+ synthase [Desulfovibrio sp.]|nr:NAD+ synthase [Desulfovibrio sp.]